MQLGFTNSYSSSIGKIWVFWQDSGFRLADMHDENQVLHLQFIYASLNFHFSCLVVYAYHLVVLKRSLWQSLRDHSQRTILPWLMCGDFNTFRSLDDHRERSHPILLALQDFNDRIEDCSLMDPPFHSSRYTWADGRGLGQVQHRLDWVFIISLFQDAFDDLRLTHLPRIHPIILLSYYFVVCQGLEDIDPLGFWMLGYLIRTFIPMSRKHGCHTQRWRNVWLL